MRVSWCTVGVCRCGLRQRNSRSSFRTAIIHAHAAAGCMGSTRSSGEFSLGPGRHLLPVTIQMASGASSWFRGSRWRAWLILQLRMQSDADRCYIAVIQLARRVSPAAGRRASFCWRNPPCRWTQPCQVVEFNYQFMSKVCYIFNMNWEWSSSTATDAGWDIRLDGSGKVSPLTEYIHVSRASSAGPSWSHHWKHEKAWMCFVAPLPGLCGISIT